MATVEGIIHNGEVSTERTSVSDSLSNVEQEGGLSALMLTGASNPKNDSEKNQGLKATVKEVVGMLRETKNKSSKSIKKSDVDKAKVCRLTSSQIEYVLSSRRR